MESGKILLLEFTDFDIFALTTKTEESTEVTADEIINVDPCPYDYVQVIDNDGTMLMLRLHESQSVQHQLLRAAEHHVKHEYGRSLLPHRWHRTTDWVESQLENREYR